MFQWFVGLLAGGPAQPVPDAVRFDRYFRNWPDPAARAAYRSVGAIGLLLASGALVALGVGAPVVAALLGGIGLALGGPAASMRAGYHRARAEVEDRPSNAAMDVRLGKQLEEIAERALKVLDLGEDDVRMMMPKWDPVGLLCGYSRAKRDRPQLIVYTPVVSERSAIGDDRIWRFSHYNVWVLCPTDYHVAVYRCRVSLIRGKRSEEATEEFYYDDIVSVLTRPGPGPELTSIPVDHLKSAWWGAGKPDRRDLQIAAPNPDKTVISVATSSGASGTIRDSGIEIAARAIRSLLKTMRAAQ